MLPLKSYRNFYARKMIFNRFALRDEINLSSYYLYEPFLKNNI